MDGELYPSIISVIGENNTVRYFTAHLILGLLAVGFEKYGSEEELEKDPIKHLFDVYVKINVIS